MNNQPSAHEQMCPVKGCYMPRHHAYVESVAGVLMHRSDVPPLPQAKEPPEDRVWVQMEPEQQPHPRLLGWALVAILWFVGSLLCALGSTPDSGWLGVLAWLFGMGFILFGIMGFFVELNALKEKDKP